MLWRLITSSLRHEPRRTVLVVAAIAVATLAATGLAHLVLATGDLFPRLVEGYGANLRITPSTENGTIPVAELEALDEIFWRNNVVGVAPLFELRVRLRGANGVSVAPLVGTWFDRSEPPRSDVRRDGLASTRPNLRLEAGRWPDSVESTGPTDVSGSTGSDPERLDEGAIGRRLAVRLGVVVDDRVEIDLGDRNRTLRIVGLVGGGGEEEETVFAPLDVAQELAGSSATMTGAEVLAHTVPETELSRRDPTTLSPEEYDAWYCTAFPSAIAHQIDEALPSAHADVMRETAGATGALFTRLEPIVLSLAALVLAAAALGIGAIAGVRALARRRGCALLAALGGTRGWIVRIFLTEAALLGAAGGLVGGALGLLLGRALATVLFGVGAGWTLVLLPFAVLVAALVSVVAAARPFLRVTAAAPADVLRGGV